MAGYPVVGVSASCTHDPQGVDIYDEEGNLTHYDLGDTVPLSKLISRRYSWLVNRGYLSEVETDDWGTASWGEITGTLSAQTDLQNALDAKLNLTGGTLTGNVTVSKANAVLSINNPSSGSVGELEFNVGGAYRWIIYKNEAAESGSNAGSNLTIAAYSDSAGVPIGSALSFTRSDLAAVFGGNVKVSKANPIFELRTAASSQWAEMKFTTNGSLRWDIAKDNTAESGSNVGSDLAIYACNDAGSAISTPLKITRATGAVTLTGGLTIIKDTPLITLNGAGYANPVYMNFYRAAGQYGGLLIATGSTSRWLVVANNAAESGSNAGSNFEIKAYSDAGALLSTPLTITRSTGDIVLASTTDSSSSTTGAIKTTGGMGIAKKLYVGTDLNVAGTIESSDVRAISQVMGVF